VRHADAARILRAAVQDLDTQQKATGALLLMLVSRDAII